MYLNSVSALSRNVTNISHMDFFIPLHLLSTLQKLVLKGQKKKKSLEFE